MQTRHNSSSLRKMVIICVVALLATATLDSQSRRHGNHSGRSGFDFYLFTLSWEPAFCSTHSSNSECRGTESFIVHGMWPEWNNGRWPQFCSNAPGLADDSVMNGIMPSNIVDHEWAKHGTCSGRSADNYFALIRQELSGIKVPADLKALTAPADWSPDQIKRDFASANPTYQPADIVLDCTGGTLVAVELCLDKTGTAQACPAIQDCNAASVKVLPPTH